MCKIYWSKELPDKEGLYWCFTGRYKSMLNTASILRVYRAADRLIADFIYNEAERVFLEDLPVRFPHIMFGERIEMPNTEGLDRELKTTGGGGIGPYCWM